MIMIKEGIMAEKEVAKVVTGEQKIVADKILRNFLIVLGIAFVAEVALHVFPSFLGDVDERAWLEWLLLGLIGVSAYLVWNVSIWYHRADEADFVAYRPWYRATAARGPIIALVILLALTNVSFQLALPAGEENAVSSEVSRTDEDVADDATSTFDFGVDFGTASEAVLLVAAFLLGFYSRLAKELLARIARAIFGSLFTDTYREEEYG
jgi:hypothetical protein